MGIDGGRPRSTASSGSARATSSFLPALGFDATSDFVGQRVEEVVPNTLMAQVIDTGQPILVDLLTNQAGTFLVSRLPLRDDGGRGDRRVRHGAARPPRNDDAAADGQVRAPAARARRRAPAAGRAAPARSTRIASFIGASAAAVEVKRQARRVAQTDSTVLLLGETGTGKELLAHGIHAASARAGKPFVGVNIAAVPETLLEAEFFGVAPGAYTGAERKGRDGKFKLADGGTLLLDEIGDMPLALQSKLLRVLQEQEVEPLGSNQVQRVDVRVIAATSRDLPAMVAAGSFRADLYYRLNVLPIRLPPLRERLADLEALVDALADDIARRSGLPHKSLSRRRAGPAGAARLAGQHPRAAQRARAGHADDRRRDASVPAHFAAAAAPGRCGRQCGARRGARARARPRRCRHRRRPKPAMALRSRCRRRGRAGARCDPPRRCSAPAATSCRRGAAAGISRATLYEKLARYPELAATAR